MDVGIVHHAGAMLRHRHMPAAPAPFLQAIAPDRDRLGVAVAGLVTWYWLADLWAAEGIVCVLGHALSLQAMQGGKANNDTSDAQQIAALLRGGLLPQASVSPATLRAPRDLVRRRTHLRRKRAELVAHGQKTKSQENLPAMGKQIAYQANREGVAERFADAAVHKTIEVDVARSTSYDERRRALALSILTTATHHAAHPLSLGQTVPGIGTILRLGRLSDIHAMDRFPRVQDLASSCRLGTWAPASAGTRVGTSGKTIGQAHRKWAFSEAAVLCLRHNLPGQKSLARLEQKHDTGQARAILAPPLARAVDEMLKRKTAFAMDVFLRAAGSRAGEPAVALDSQGLSLHTCPGNI